MRDQRAGVKTSRREWLTAAGSALAGLALRSRQACAESPFTTADFHAFNSVNAYLARLAMEAGGVSPRSPKQGFQASPINGGGKGGARSVGGSVCIDRIGSIPGTSWVLMGGDPSVSQVDSSKFVDPKVLQADLPRQRDILADRNKLVYVLEFARTTITYNLLGRALLTHQPSTVCFNQCKFESGWAPAVSTARGWLAADKQPLTGSLRGPLCLGRVLVFNDVIALSGESGAEQVFQDAASTRPIGVWIDDRGVAISTEVLDPIVKEFERQLDALPEEGSLGTAPLKTSGNEARELFEKVGAAKTDDMYFAALRYGTGLLARTPVAFLRLYDRRTLVVSEPRGFGSGWESEMKERGIDIQRPVDQNPGFNRSSRSVAG